MNQYKIYFEFFGRKMKTTITAKNESEAKQILARKIIFHKVEKKEPDGGPVVDFLKGFINENRK